MHVLKPFWSTLKLFHVLSHAIKAVECSLQDIWSNNCPFGGITVIFGGDFQQTLPVIVKGSHEDVLLATLQRSVLWNNMNILRLRVNMRLNREPQAEQFAHWLLDIGHGRVSSQDNIPGSIMIPNTMLFNDMDALISSVYGTMAISDNPPPPQFFQDRIILAPRNEDVHALNTSILHLLHGNEQMYTSADTHSFEPGAEQYQHNIPLEFLQSLNASGLPLTHLCLKEGCPIMLLRNLDST